ncbi:MAG: TonB-dependent receptor [Weeksellaceae bacterium]|nr:TonB-dependent receptor [Weeksellaceae bacterium]
MKCRIFLLGLVCTSLMNAQQTETADTLAIQLGTAEIIQKLPVTTEKLGKQQLNQRNLGQDITSLIGNQTSVVVTSDAGAGIGYSSVRIRGVAQDHINITMNGVPLNDPESQNVFWVNMPDMASSASSVLIQRGVGTSASGTAAFGAAINIESEQPSAVSFIEGSISGGSFNTQKYSLKGGSGNLLNGKLRMNINASVIQSDGYIDRAFSDLYSFGINARYKTGSNTTFTYWNFNGNEKTYQAWNGIDGEMLKTNRRFNPAGAIYDDDGNIVDYYKNETDNYRQSHHHLGWQQNYGKGWKSSTTLYYTRGKGYYENYKQNAKLYQYKIESETERADLIRQKWLDNHLYGLNFNFENQRLGNVKLFSGFALNQYTNKHYGKVIWLENQPNWNPDFEFYRNHSDKSEFSVYSKAIWQLNRFEIFGDLQYRYVSYKTRAAENGENEYEDFFPFEDKLNFVNPKIGLNYNLNTRQTLYFYYGMSHREPIRSDYIDNGRKLDPETLHDFELGYKKSGRLKLNANLFYMYYLDQLVATGQLNDTGNYIRTNSGKSFRTGIELSFGYEILESKLDLYGNLSRNISKNMDYSEIAYDEQGNEIIIDYGDTSISFSPEWVAAAGLDYSPIKQLHFNVSGKYTGSQFLTNTERNDGKLDAYFLTDLLIRYQPNVKALKNLEFSLLINNLFDIEYESNGFYYEGAYYYPQAGINILGGLSFRF